MFLVFSVSDVKLVTKPNADSAFMRSTFPPACSCADTKTLNKNHNQRKWRQETLLRGNKRNRGLCGRNNEAEAAAFLLWFCNNVALCIL